LIWELPIKLALLILISFYSISTNAFECSFVPDYSLPIVKLGDHEVKDDFWGAAASIDDKVCYDEKEFKNDAIVLSALLKLRESKALDSNNCLTDKELTDAEAGLMSDVIVKFLSKPIKLYALADSKTGELKKIVYTNSMNPNFASNSLNAKDKVELSGITLVSSSLGILVERKMFPGEKDKNIHAFAGAAINVGSNLASYVVIEEMGLGDKLKLNKNQKKAVILLTGSAMGLLVGYAKERLYDYYRQKNHTYDPKLKGDMGATMLGGGALTPIYITFKAVW
jgi:hypothetical protein